MYFEYVGPESLVRPEVFTQILVSAVEDTGLANHFYAEPSYEEIDKALKLFETTAFHLMYRADHRPGKMLSILVAAAIHVVSLCRIIDKNRVRFIDRKIVGLHAEAVAKNPNELVALTFGLAISEVNAHWKRSHTAIVYGASRVDLAAISPPEIRNAISTIAAIRNRDLRSKGPHRLDVPFRQLLRLMGKLRVARFQRIKR